MVLNKMWVGNHSNVKKEKKMIWGCNQMKLNFSVSLFYKLKMFLDSSANQSINELSTGNLNRSSNC